MQSDRSSPENWITGLNLQRRSESVREISPIVIEHVIEPFQVSQDSRAGQFNCQSI
jgi:hypothetical protein